MVIPISFTLVVESDPDLLETLPQDRKLCTSVAEASR